MTIAKIKQQLEENKNGITLNLNGDIPKHKKGFYCSITNNVYQELTAKDIKKVLKVARAETKRTGLKHYIGGWFSSESKKFYVDVSRRFYSKDRAIKTGRKFKQEAIFNIQKLDCITV